MSKGFNQQLKKAIKGRIPGSQILDLPSPKENIIMKKMNQKKLEKEITHEELFDVEQVPEIQAIIKKSNQSLIKKILRKETALLNNIGDTIWAVTSEDIKKIREEVK